MQSFLQCSEIDDNAPPRPQYFGSDDGTFPKPQYSKIDDSASSGPQYSKINNSDIFLDDLYNISDDKMPQPNMQSFF